MEPSSVCSKSDPRSHHITLKSGPLRFNFVFIASLILSKCYGNGKLDLFSWDSAWWACSLVANCAYDRWSRVLPDIQAVQRETEKKFLALQPAVEQTALRLAKSDKAALHAHLTDYSNSCGQRVLRRWRELAGEILVKHNDGWLKNPGEIPKGVGYPEPWRRRVVKERGADYSIEGSE